MAGTFELDLQEELGGGCSRFREQRCRKEQSVLEEQSCGAWGALGRRHEVEFGGLWPLCEVL